MREWAGGRGGRRGGSHQRGCNLGGVGAGRNATATADQRRRRCWARQGRSWSRHRRHGGRSPIAIFGGQAVRIMRALTKRAKRPTGTARERGGGCQAPGASAGRPDPRPAARRRVRGPAPPSPEPRAESAVANRREQRPHLSFLRLQHRQPLLHLPPPPPRSGLNTSTSCLRSTLCRARCSGCDERDDNHDPRGAAPAGAPPSGAAPVAHVQRT